jgi:hypothetical protein
VSSIFGREISVRNRRLELEQFSTTYFIRHISVPLLHKSYRHWRSIPEESRLSKLNIIKNDSIAQTIHVIDLQGMIYGKQAGLSLYTICMRESWQARLFIIHNFKRDVRNNNDVNHEKQIMSKQATPSINQNMPEHRFFKANITSYRI